MPPKRQPETPAQSRRTRAASGDEGGESSESPDSTRSLVIEAAIACILEEGFYRASSNAIARRANVTWGVIQYHFGSREALLIAVLEHASSQFQATLSSARIEGELLEERLSSFAQVVWSYYGRPEFLAYIQVLLNLSHDPNTEEQTRQAIRANQLHVSSQLPPLLRQAIEPAVESSHPKAPALRNFVFSSLRGMAIDQAHLKALPRDVPVDPDLQLAERQMLVEALARHVVATVETPAKSRRDGRARAR